MSEQTDAPKPILLPELVNQYTWAGNQVGTDNGPITVLTISHPRHGDMHYWLDKRTIAALRDWLITITVPQTPPN